MSLIDTFRERLMAPERARMKEMLSTVMQAYEAGMYELPPQELTRQLSEYDPELVQA